MRLFDRFKLTKNELSEADAAAEALRAYRLIQEAAGGSLTTAVEKLGEFQRLVKGSSQRDIYDPGVVQEVLGNYVAQYISKTSPHSFQPKLPLSIGNVCAATVPLETVIDNAIFIIGEATNGLMDVPRIKQLALKACRTILEGKYQRILQDMAKTALANEGDVSHDFEGLVNAYEQLCINYRQDVGTVTIPLIQFKQHGDMIERNTTRVVYRAALNNSQARLGEAFSQDNEKVASDYVAELVETALAQIDKYALNAELSADDKQRFISKVHEFSQARDGLVTKVSGAICEKQDELYGAVETLATEGDYGAAVSAMNILEEYTARYSRILEETAGEAKNRAQIILRQYFELEATS